MTDKERVQTKQWVAYWKSVAPKLESIRRAEIRKVDTPTAIRHFTDPKGIRARLRPTSGLVEQQRWFQKLHHP